MFSDSYRIQHKKFLNKCVHTPDGIFDSMTEAAEYYKVCRSTITYRVKSKSEKLKEWRLIKGENDE